MDGEHLVSGKVWRGPTPREEQRTVKRDEREGGKKRKNPRKRDELRNRGRSCSPKFRNRTIN